MNLIYILLFLQYHISSAFNLITKSILGYGGYSLLIDLWCSSQIKQMQKNECYNKLPDNFVLKENKFMISNVSNVIENIEYRKSWNTFMNLYKNNNIPQPGIYNFIHRNYANNEEKIVMCNGRNTLHKFFIKLKQTGNVEIFSNNSIYLNENIILFSFYPIQIKWHGIIINNQVKWIDTFFLSPNNIINNPKTAEELSKYNWNITACDNDYILFRKDRHDTNEQIIYANL